MTSDIEVKKTVVAIQGIPVEAGTPSDGYVLTYVGLDSQWEAQPLPPVPHFDGYGSGVNEFTGTGTIATFKSTESILGLNTNVPLKEFTGEIVPNGTTQNLLVSYLIPLGIQNWDLSVLGADGYLNIYKSNLNFLTVNQSTGFMLPTGPSPTNIISYGLASSWLPIATTATGYLNIYGNGNTGTYWSINGKVQYLSQYFNPRNITGCQLWLRADLGLTVSSGNVVSWNDQSGNTDSNRNFTPLSAPPQFNATDTNFNMCPSIVFPGGEGNNTSLISGIWNTTINEPFTTIIVGLSPGGPGNNDGFMASSDASFSITLDSYWYMQNTYGQLNTPGLPSGTPTILYLEWNAPNDTMRINAQTPSLTGNLGGVSTIGQASVFIGQDEYGNGLDGTITEVIVYNKILSTGELSTIMSYLGNRYNITIGS